MNSVSVNKFKDNLKSFVDQSFADHKPLKVMRRNAQDFVVMSAEDYAREQETLYILQNNDMMRQFNESMETHKKRTGYRPTTEQMDEILNF
ncbi:RelB/StbD replicon stabilization protein (antitoxin to RelE/StbE) [hydrothermal vent metagenome]|uniref:RelB/StbD replicon stabilization protein (Antitoxin to RelE/StbE) n=1 Tax=hydrothermal vent metagenome TaxID=652676 RepID=A0A1W1E3D9_9ZZZZ